MFEAKLCCDRCLIPENCVKNAKTIAASLTKKASDQVTRTSRALPKIQKMLGKKSHGRVAKTIRGSSGVNSPTAPRSITWR
mmetsp:Transcript_4276/g.10184  ORF Transcript_4276/g.10184 Transcript_4276/m.10184 type:complete len:81 (+) Transcript_4276:2154-2396(+)